MAQQGSVAKSLINKDGLTPKQAKFVKAIAEGKNSSQAALEAYDTTSERVASVIAAENLTKPSVKEAVAKALDKNLLSADDAVKPVKRALEYRGDTERESLEMNLKGVDRLMRLLQMTEDKDKGGGNTFTFVNGQVNQYMKKS